MMETFQNTKWRKVSGPKTWRPKAGDELTGFFCGKTKRDGQYGQYEVIIVAVEEGKSYMISGTRIIQLVDVAMLNFGDKIRIVFNGIVDLDEERSMKEFELYVEVI